MKAATHLQKKTTEARRAQRKANKILAALLLVLAVGAAAAYAQAGGGYDLTWNTIDGGGATRSTGSGGGYSLGGTAGQPDAATWTGGGYTLAGGFWHAALGAGGGASVYLPIIVRNH